MKLVIACLVALLGLTTPARAESAKEVPTPDTHRLGFPTVAPLAMIPTLANTPGRFGAFFKTKVVIQNHTDNDFDIRAVLYGPNGRVGRRTIAMKANSFNVYENFLDEVFSYRGAGAVSLLAEEQEHEFAVTAEVYTESDSGRYSTTVLNGLMPLLEPSSKGEHFSAGVTVDSNTRVNIGVFNLLAADATVRAHVYDGSNNRVQTIRFDVAGETWQQKSLSAPVKNGHIRWESESEGEALPYLWVISVDNRSNDGVLTWPIQTEAPF